MWKEIIGYENYLINESGEVFNSKNGIKLKKRKVTRSGYLSYWLIKNKIGKNFSIHRLVALTFIPNPENKRTVNHKNGIKTDNRVENLEWMTHSENHKHSYDTLKRKAGMTGKTGEKCYLFGMTGVLNHLSIPVLQMSKNGEIIAEFCNSREASQKTGVNNGHIASVITGKRPTAGGYVWKRKPITESDL